MGRGCAESKRTAILSGLTIHSPLHTLHNPYNLGLPLFGKIPGVRYVEGTATKHHKYRQVTTGFHIRGKESNLMNRLRGMLMGKFVIGYTFYHLYPIFRASLVAQW